MIPRGILILLLPCLCVAADFSFTVEPAEEWNARFRCTEGWAGADGIYSFAVGEAKTLFVFSDTWIGSVNPQTRRRKQMKLINNSMAILDGEMLEFLWNKEESAAAFLPADVGSWYWLQDGFLHDGHLYNFPMRVEKDADGATGFQFRTIGVDLLRIPLQGGRPDLLRSQQEALPLFAGGDFFGAGVLSDVGDGYIYVYGRRHRPFQVELLVARVEPERVAEPDAWRFWNGKAWGSLIAESASLGPGGPELSVTRLASGKYLLVTMPISRELFIRIGERPEGPFGPRIVIYRTPEPDMFPGAYTYNAKAHPALSAAGSLLISYNVNAATLAAHKENADIYRPRFITLRLGAER